MSLFYAPKVLFRTLAIAEAVSWTLLIGGMVLRATFGWSLAVTIGGGVHGFVFLSYGAAAVLIAKNQRWGAWPAFVAIVSAVIPYATIPSEIWLTRTARLEGMWRREKGNDPRDAAWHDRLLRVLLRRPWMLFLLIAAAVALIFVALLLIGPPGGHDS